MEIQYASETLNHLDMSLEQQKLPQTQPQSNKHLTRGKVSITSILCKQFSVFSITFPLSIALFIYFWVLFIYQKVSDNLFGCVLYECGAKFAPDVQHRGEFHRMIVSIPQFGGISQILIGVMTMQMYGYVAERRFGGIKYCLILLLAGYASNLMSSLIYPYHVTVGSYGIIYGVLVIYGSTILTQQLGVYKKLVIGIYCVVFGINFIPLIGTNQIDIGCILGGILSSVFLVLYFQQTQWKHGKIIKYGALALEVTFIVTCTVLLFTLSIDDISAARFSDFHETSSGIKISRKSIIKGTEQINVSGRCIFFHDVILRGDLAKVSFGKYMVVHEKVILKPSYTYGYTKETPSKRVIKFLPLTISDYVEIESNSIVQASKIGTCSHIGKNCVISHRCIIGENSIILDDSILPPDTVVPANSVYGGRPAVYIAETPEATGIIQKQKLMNFYKNFQPKQ